MTEDRDLEQRVRSAIARVPAVERPLGERPRRRTPSGLVAVGAAVAILVAAIGAGQWLASYRAASAGSCGSLDVLTAPPQTHTPAPLRTIRLDQRWTINGVGTFCVAGILVYDGSFAIIGYEQGQWSWAEPWTAAGGGMVLSFLRDDQGRTFAGSSSGGLTGPIGKGRIWWYEGYLFPRLTTATGDLLAGVHELHFDVQHVLQPVRGPWRFGGVVAKGGTLTAATTAAGRDMHLYDLVLRSDGFSVAYLPLDGPVTAGRVVLSDPLTVRDDHGTTYTWVGVERVGSSPNLYAKFTPTPPTGALLTIEIPTVYVSSDQNWQAKLTLP